MNKLQVAIIVVFAAIYSLYFFYKASGSLNPGKFNIITVTGGLFFLQTFIGIVLIVFGLDKHYTLNKLLNRDESIAITFYVVMGVAVLLPAMIYLFLRLFKVDSHRDYAAFLRKDTQYFDSGILFWMVVGASVVCMGLLMVYLTKVGYIPLIKLFFHDESFNMGAERVRNANITVINDIITNIMIHLAIPVMAYFTFTCAISSKKPKWWILAVILFGASLIVKTYNFAKAPVIYFFMVYLFILIYYRGGIKARWMFLFAGFGVAVLLMFYSISGASTDLTDIYNGIWGRSFFTQVGTLSYNFDLFPNYVPYLGGRSFGKLLLPLFGFESSAQIRSGRVLMEIYGSESVYSGTAGVMNSIFLGEAYANFGWGGLLFSVIWIALLMAGLFTIVIKMRKTPAMITLFAYFTVYFATATQGGFIDFIYNIGWILVIGAMLVCHWLFWRHSKKESQPN